MGRIRDEMRAAFERAQEFPPRTPPTAAHPTERQPLHDGDPHGWLAAAQQREPPRPRDRQTLRNYLQAKSPWRWKALQRNLRWAEKEMLKLGLNPEDARWLL